MRTKPDWTLILLSAFVEYCLIYIFLVPFDSTENQWTFAVPLSILTATTLAVYLLIRSVIKKDIFVLYFIVAVGVFFLGLALGLSLFLSFISSVLLFWRMMDALNGLTYKRLWIILIVSASASIFFAFTFGMVRPGFKDPFLFLVVLLIQAAAAYILYLLQNVKSFKAGTHLTVFLITVFGGIGVMAALLRYVGPYIAAAVRYVLLGASMALFYIIGLIFALFSALIGDTSKFKQIEKSLTGKTNKKGLEYSNQYYNPHQWDWLGIVLLIVVAIAVFYILRRRWMARKKLKPGFRQTVVAKHSAVEKGSNSFLKRRYKAPKNPVRQLLFQLQMKLRKSNDGRSGSETVEEWLERLPTGPEDKSVITNAYQKVRYGNQPISQSEVNTYNQAIKDLIKKIKEKRADE